MVGPTTNASYPKATTTRLQSNAKKNNLPNHPMICCPPSPTTPSSTRRNRQRKTPSPTQPTSRTSLPTPPSLTPTGLTPLPLPNEDTPWASVFAWGTHTLLSNNNAHNLTLPLQRPCPSFRLPRRLRPRTNPTLTAPRKTFTSNGTTRDTKYGFTHTFGTHPKPAPFSSSTFCSTPEPARGRLRPLNSGASYATGAVTSWHHGRANRTLAPYVLSIKMRGVTDEPNMRRVKL